MFVEADCIDTELGAGIGVGMDTDMDTVDI